ncbi:hypothetical protein D3C83_111200 [compost metagenome]
MIASLGVAAVSYVACSSSSGTSGNLVAPDPDASDSGASDTGSDAKDDDTSFLDQVANLVPPDYDAGK